MGYLPARRAGRIDPRRASRGLPPFTLLMKTQSYRSGLAAMILALLGAVSLCGAETLTVDLKKLADGAPASGPKAMRWEADVKGRAALFAASFVWLEGVDFKEGTIECDILGKALPRGSNFPGVAFHGVNDTTYDSVYFRPFNFRAENPENAAHAIQYVAVPDWPWPKLRAERTGQYEKPIAPAPDGDQWFHAKIVVAGGKVSVFVNGADKPSLEVGLLNERTGGRIGITGGDAGDGAYFAKVKITPKG